MELPIGMLIYKAQKLSDEQALLTGIWYFQEMYVPQTKEEKIQSYEDLKKKRCTVLTLIGTYEQICEILMQSDAYQEGTDRQISAYTKMLDKLANSQDQPVMFDEFTSIKGTALSVDTTVNIDEEMSEVHALIRTWKPVKFKISENWSYFNLLFPKK